MAAKTKGNRSLARSKTAARVGKESPVHAAGMRELIGISSDIRQGEDFGAMRLDFELDCGTARLRVNEGIFTVAMAVCHVALRLKNCSVKPHTRYEARLADGDIAVHLLETTDRSMRREMSIGVDGATKASATRGLSGRFSLKAALAGGRKAESAAQETLDRRARLDLVVMAGQDRWQIGDPQFGDARRNDGKLQGAYFGEVRDENGEAKPLCTIVGGTGDAPAEIIVSALVRAGQLLVTFADAAASPEQVDDVEAMLRKSGAQAAKTHESKTADLRARVAGLVLAKEMLVEQQRHHDSSETDILVARQSLVAVPTTFGRGAGGK